MRTPSICSVSRVAVAAPRASASAMRAAVSSGHLIWTKCTSSARSMPASRMAAATPAATVRTCAVRPRCSGARGGVRTDRPPEQRRRDADWFSGRDLAYLEHAEMRGERSLRPAGHHHAGVRCRRRGPSPSGTGKREGGEAAREVVHAAIALGLADDGDDGVGIDTPLLDRACEPDTSSGAAALMR